MMPRAIIFYHFPKTAGSSIRSIIKNQYKNNCFVIDGIQHIKSFLEIVEGKNDIAVIGHHTLGVHEYIEDTYECCYFTFLRDPWSIFLSYFKFLKKIDQTNLNLDEFILQYEHNMLVRRFGNGDIDLALENINNLFEIGIVEFMHESLNYLKQKIGISFDSIPQKNVSQKTVTQIPSLYIDWFKQRNNLDYKLYEFALTKFNLQRQSFCLPESTNMSGNINIQSPVYSRSIIADYKPDDSNFNAQELKQKNVSPQTSTQYSHLLNALKLAGKTKEYTLLLDEAFNRWPDDFRLAKAISLRENHPLQALKILLAHEVALKPLGTNFAGSLANVFLSAIEFVKGQIFEQNGQTDQALTSYAAALRYMPYEDKYLQAQVAILRKEKRYKEALAQLGLHEKNMARLPNAELIQLERLVTIYESLDGQDRIAAIHSAISRDTIPSILDLIDQELIHPIDNLTTANHVLICNVCPALIFDYFMDNFIKHKCEATVLSSKNSFNRVDTSAVTRVEYLPPAFFNFDEHIGTINIDLKKHSYTFAAVLMSRHKIHNYQEIVKLLRWLKIKKIVFYSIDNILCSRYRDKVIIEDTTVID